MDLSYLVNQIKAPQSSLKLRQATVITVNADRTMDVQIAGDGYTLPSVRYLSNYAPKPSDQVWLLNDGADLLGIGMVAGVDRTLAPTAYITSPVTVPLNTEYYLPFTAERNNGWNCWNVSQPTRLTAPVTGLYQATAVVVSSSHANTDLSIGIRKNGTNAIVRQDVTMKVSADDFHGMVTSTPFEMTKGDYIEMMIKHDFNPSLTLLTTSHGYDHVGYYNCLSFIYLGS